MAQAYFRIGGRTLEMFGPRAEQIAHLLELDRSKVAARLAERIGKNVSHAEGGEDVERPEDVSEDVTALRDAFRRSLGA